MKNVKECMALGLALILTGSMLAGCGQKADVGKADDQKTPDQAGAQSESTASGGKAKLTFSMWDPMPEGNNFIAKFMEENPDIEIELVSFPDDNYSTKLNTMVATGSEPDVMLVWECDLPSFADGGKIVPLDDYISKSEVVKMDDLLPAMMTLQEMNGATYGLPWCYATQILYYNKDMFDAAGVAYPSDDWTWKEYTEAAKKLTIREGENVVQWGEANIGHKGAWYSMIGAGGDDIIDAEGNLTIGEGTKKALQFQYDLINTYKVSPEIAASSDSADLFAAGRAAMVRTGSWMTSGYREVPFNWDIAMLPKGERNYAGIHTGFYTISKNCENPDAAWKFIEFCMSKTGQEMITKGFGNPSAVKSLNEAKLHENPGPNGPSNWEVFSKSADIAECGFTLLPAGITDDLLKKFEAAVMGQTSIDDAIKSGVEEANKVLKAQ